MRYAILGTGVVGRTVATRLASLGHEVVIGTRDPEATLARTEYATWQEAHPAVALATFPEAARQGDTLVNATGGGSASRRSRRRTPRTSAARS